MLRTDPSALPRCLTGRRASRRLATALAPLVALTVLAAAAEAAGTRRSEVTDLVLGSRAETLPSDFVDLACGTDGGPPSAPLRSFTDFMQCPADPRGLREVYFRYNDSDEYAARALDQATASGRLGGTRVFDFPVIASALFDARGVLAAVRLHADPREADATERSTFWSLGTVLRNHFGDTGWTCTELPLTEGERPVGNYAIKDNCEKRLAAVVLTVDRRYLRRRGQAAIDALTGTVIPGAFSSSTRFEMRLEGPGPVPSPLGPAPPR